MSEPTTSSSPDVVGSDGHYLNLIAPVQARFSALTQLSPGRTHLFHTDSTDLFARYLEALPPERRQRYTCHCCRRFIERYGGLVMVAADGATVPVMWDPAATLEPQASAFRALALAVARAPITGLFLSEDRLWGQPETGPWRHMAVVPPESCVHRPGAVQSTSQAIAEKAQDHSTLLRALDEFPLELVRNAHTLLTSESLYRSEKCVGVARWLLDLHEQRRATLDERLRDNLTWLAVAGAPPGFCHVRGGMIGTLLEDLAAGLPFADIKARFDAKMNPLQYQRPTAAPSAGNIAQAEQVIARLRSAGALERRFARLADIEPLWLPTPPKEAPRTGVFSHIKARTAAPAPVDVPPVTMTWEKFARTVLPTAEQIEYFVPTSNQPYVGMVTAQNPDAPPIVQWDREARRNPVTWYFYHNGSTPARWNLPPGAYHPVTAITLQPAMWHDPERYTNQGQKVFFILAGARDTQYISGSGFFPEFLKSEYHPIRATIEAYAKQAVVAGKDEAEACGLGLAKGVAWNNQLFRVTAQGGVRLTYRLDRWD
jgi:hypothetical protein